MHSLCFSVAAIRKIALSISFIAIFIHTPQLSASPDDDQNLVSDIQPSFRDGSPARVFVRNHVYGPRAVKTPFGGMVRNFVFREDQVVVESFEENEQITGQEASLIITYRADTTDHYRGDIFQLRLTDPKPGNEILANRLTPVTFQRIEVRAASKYGRKVIYQILRHQRNFVTKNLSAPWPYIPSHEWIDVTDVEPFNEAILGDDSVYFIPFDDREPFLDLNGEKPYVLRVEEQNLGWGWVYGINSIEDIPKYLWDEEKGDGHPPFFQISCVRNVEYDFEMMMLSTQEIQQAYRICHEEVEEVIAEYKEQDLHYMDYLSLDPEEEIAIFEAMSDFVLEMDRAVTGKMANDSYLVDGTFRFFSGLGNLLVLNPLKCAFGACGTAIGVLTLPFDQGTLLNRGSGLLVKGALSEVTAVTGIAIGTLEIFIISPANAGKNLIFGE